MDTDQTHEQPRVPLGPEKTEELRIRRKMPGVLRFNRRTMTIVYVAGGVVLLAVLYAMGFFGGGRKGVAGVATPPPVADLSSPLPAVSPGTNPNANTFTVPSAPPTGTPPPGYGQQTPNPHAADELRRALARASRTATSAPMIPQGSSGGAPSSLPPPVAVPEPGASAAVGGSAPNRLTQAAGGGQSFYVGSNNLGENATTPSTGAETGPSSSSSPNPGPNDRTALEQQQRQRFAQDDQPNAGGPHLGGYLTQSVQKAPSRFELWAGSTIPAQLDTGINSDLPGPAVAHVVSDVYDSRNGSYLLIPRNARLIGHYNSSISVGQARIQILWDRLIWPDGRQIDIEGMPGADTEGNAGLFADVNDHRGRIITTTIITGLLAGAGQLAQGGQNSLITVNPYTGQAVALQPSVGSILASNMAQSAQSAGSQIINQTSQQPPTLTVPKGERFSVILDRTIELQPYVADQVGP